MRKIIFTILMCSVLCFSGCLIDDGKPYGWHPQTLSESIVTNYNYYVSVDVYKNGVFTQIKKKSGKLRIEASSSIKEAVDIYFSMGDAEYGWNSNKIELKDVPVTGEIKNVKMNYNRNATVNWDYALNYKTNVDMVGWMRTFSATRCSPAEPGYMYYKIDMIIEFELKNEDSTDKIKLVLKRGGDDY